MHSVAATGGLLVSNGRGSPSDHDTDDDRRATHHNLINDIQLVRRKFYSFRSLQNRTPRQILVELSQLPVLLPLQRFTFG